MIAEKAADLILNRDREHDEPSRGQNRHREGNVH
jgi:hypothetical protein